MRYEKTRGFSNTTLVTLLIIAYLAAIVGVVVAIIDKDYIRAILYLLLVFWLGKQLK